MRSVLLAGMAMGLAISGCATAPPGTAAAAAALTECDITRCGTNSPVIDQILFHELNLKGLPNAQGLRLSKFVKGTTEYILQVQNGRMSGSAASGKISGSGLIGSQIIVVDDMGRVFAINVVGVGSVHYWAALKGVPPEAVPTIETYELRWMAINGSELRPLCGVLQSGWVTDMLRDTLGMNIGTAVLFENDRIDGAAKTVAPVMNPDWFNIGCAGNAIAKLALTGHNEAARSAGYVTTTSERQAMLKMLVGDYCGDGTAFTVPGQPLYWQDDHSWMQFLRPTVHTPLDARWSSAGAICLGAPRLDDNVPKTWPEPLSMPAIMDIHKACPSLPPCSDGDPYQQGGAHLVSANPD
jgi:hypothetical protein